jgi:microsomal epoxide hydrolase
MPAPFTDLPAKPTLHPAPFIVSIPQATLDELQTLLNHSKLAPDTREGSHDDRKYGVTNKWIRDAKSVWQNKFNW